MSHLEFFLWRKTQEPNCPIHFIELYNELFRR